MTFASFLAYSGLRFPSVSMGQAYHEETFRHFLVRERKRAEGSTRSFLLVLVSKINLVETGVRMSPGLAEAIFSSLALSTREVDFIGWYREGRIAGAVLAQGADPPAEVSQRVADRIVEILCDRLPARVHQQLQVRVVRMRRKISG